MAEQGAGRGTVGAEAGPAGGGEGAGREPPQGGCFAAQGLTRGRPSRLQAYVRPMAVFSGTQSKAWSLGENSASLTSRVKWQEVPAPACCPWEPEECPTASALGSSAAAGSSPLSTRSLGSISHSRCPAGSCQGPRARETPVRDDLGTAGLSDGVGEGAGHDEWLSFLLRCWPAV